MTHTNRLSSSSVIELLDKPKMKSLDLQSKLTNSKLCCKSLSGKEPLKMVM